jgi:2-polyprenyl-6-methoxyphenol hydroxylase-like FAD-dependent oxidoreductase
MPEPYDLIVAGGGSAGCIVAAELVSATSEPTMLMGFRAARYLREDLAVEQG